MTPASANVNDVAEAAKKIQPYYAVPTQWCTLNELPHTAYGALYVILLTHVPHYFLFRNGKIDKRALKQLAGEQVNANAQTAALAIAQTAVAVSKVAEVVAEKVIKSAVAIPEKKMAIDPSFYANNLYSKSNTSNDSDPTIPPPVYSSTAASSEKNLTFDKVSAVEKETHEWDGYEDDEIPDKIHGKFLRNLRYQILSLYRRLFGVIFVTNVAVLIWTLVRPEGADAQHLGLVVVSNLFCAILMRQDYVINAFFTVACAVPSS